MMRLGIKLIKKMNLGIIGILILCLYFGMSVRGFAEQVAIPQPHTYKQYRLKLSVSERRPENGQPVILNMQVVPPITGNKVRFSYVINGKNYESSNNTSIHTFTRTGTHKVVANAIFDNGVILTSSPAIVHVVAAWDKPVAKITPEIENVIVGEPAVFYSESEVDRDSRRWLYWEMSNGHKGRGDELHINTTRLKPGRYTIELLVRDDRQRESRAQATLVLKETESDPDIEIIGETEQGEDLVSQSPDSLVLKASQFHRLEGKPMVFWIDNAQPGAETLLRLDTGDHFITPWGRRFRYNHIYDSFGIYTVQAMAKTDDKVLKSNIVRVYIWPLWFPVFLVLAGLMVAAIPFIRRQKKKLIKQEDESVVLLSTNVIFGDPVYEINKKSPVNNQLDSGTSNTGYHLSFGLREDKNGNISINHRTQENDVGEDKQGG